MSDTARGVPYSWSMPDPLVLAHRFNTPEVLPPFTSVVVKPGQQAFTSVNDVQTVHREAATHVLTGTLNHTIEQAVTIGQMGGEAHISYHAEIILFDMRPKVLPQETILLTAANGEEVAAFLSLTYQVDSVEALNCCGAVYQPAADASEIRQDDPVLEAAFRQAMAHITHALEQMAAKECDAAAVEKLTASTALTELCRSARCFLAPAGLLLKSVRISPVRRICPYCSLHLSLTELKNLRCEKEDCRRQLHACPSCGKLVRLGDTSCPHCRHELLWCGAPGCQQYRLVDRGRFCPVCRRACYPLPPRTFL